MNCIIPGNNLKVLGKALQALSKVGDELFVEARQDKLTLVTISPNKTVCARFHFLDIFFSAYQVDQNDLNALNRDNIPCKIHLKVLLPLFRGNLEKKLDFFNIEYETDASYMLIKMKYKCDDLVMVHKLRLMENESLTIEVVPDSGSNHFTAPGGFFNQLLTMFNVSDNEVTFEAGKHKVVVRNYCQGVPRNVKKMRTQISLHMGEFLNYKIRTEATVNFSLKPFKTAIHFAESLGLNVEFHFDVGGKPLSMVMRNPTFEVNFIVASLDPNKQDAASSIVSTPPTRAGSPRQDAEVTMDDLRAINAENWDDDGDLMVVDDTSRDKGEKNEDVVVIPRSPESPRSKRCKTVFSRCFDCTYHESTTGARVLALNSDSE